MVDCKNIKQLYHRLHDVFAETSIFDDMIGFQFVPLIQKHSNKAGMKSKLYVWSSSSMVWFYNCFCKYLDAIDVSYFQLTLISCPFQYEYIS